MGGSQNQEPLFGNAQAHEQNNAVVKGSGGAVGLTQNPSALRKFGPEQARLIEEFEEHFLIAKEGECAHHDEGLSTQKTCSFFGGGD